MDKKDYTLAELLKLGEELAIPGLYSKRNQDKAHLTRYIEWWQRLTQMEQEIEPTEETADCAAVSDFVQNHPPVNRSKAIQFIDHIGVPVDPTPNLYTQTVEWDDWEFSEGYTEEEIDPFHHIDITHKLTGKTWMVSIDEHGGNFLQAFKKLTNIIKSLTKDKPTLTRGRSPPPLKTHLQTIIPSNK